MRASDVRVGIAADLSLRALGAAGAYGDSARVAHLVRGALRSAGLGVTRPGVPLADLIAPGMRVLLKPNWVLDRNLSSGGIECMVTHPAIVSAVLDEVLEARPSAVIIGDAPLQGCRFERLIDARLRLAAGRAACPVDFVDFRRTVANDRDLSVGVEVDRRSEDRYVRFDLGRESCLEPVSSPQGRFRVTNYDPDLLARTHGPGRHEYLLCREAFEADVVISLPKLKTHAKAGITGALKNVVGLNGNKEFLPHHRVGGSIDGGDCYEGSSLTRRAIEAALDRGNRAIGTPECRRWYRRAGRLMKRQQRFGPVQIEGSWPGNDTVWRTVLDLNRIVLYGRSDGTMGDAPQRKVYSLTDAIVMGEGDGPLAPTPLVAGVVTFAGSSPFADRLHAALLGFDWSRLPLVRESFRRRRYPLEQEAPDAAVAIEGGRGFSVAEAASRFGRSVVAPPGWGEHLDRSRSLSMTT